MPAATEARRFRSAPRTRFRNEVQKDRRHFAVIEDRAKRKKNSRKEMEDEEREREREYDSPQERRSFPSHSWYRPIFLASSHDSFIPRRMRSDRRSLPASSTKTPANHPFRPSAIGSTGMYAPDLSDSTVRCRLVNHL